MGMSAAMEAMQTVIETTAGALAPESVYLVPQERGDARPNKREERWVNIEPAGEMYTSETGGSYIAGYKIKVTAWILQRNKTLELTTSQVAQYWQPILKTILHSRLDGYARIAVQGEDIDDAEYIAGGDKDVRYGIEATITVYRQETTA